MKLRSVPHAPGKSEATLNTLILNFPKLSKAKRGNVCINVTLRRVRVTIFPWRSNKCHMQSACAVLYCHLWPVWLYHIFLHYLINGTIFRKMLLNIKCVFLFPLQLLSEIFLILRRIQRDVIINVHTSSCKVPLLLSDFNVT
jgi:hypothetical protein